MLRLYRTTGCAAVLCKLTALLYTDQWAVVPGRRSFGECCLQAALTAERADEDKAKLEAELAAALTTASTPPDQTVSSQPSAMAPEGRPQHAAEVFDWKHEEGSCC
jgi:hypothetical protein